MNFPPLCFESGLGSHEVIRRVAGKGRLGIMGIWYRECQSLSGPRKVTQILSVEHRRILLISSGKEGKEELTTVIGSPAQVTAFYQRIFKQIGRHT